MTTLSALSARRAGLLILGLLSLADLATPFLTDGEHPPFAVAVLVALLGAASLALAVQALRDPLRSLRLLITLRVLSAVSTVPAFVEPGVPGHVQVIAGALIALTTAGVLLSASTRTTAVAS